MNKERAIEVFKKTGVLLEGHFLLTSGRHSDKYLQCAKIFQFPEYGKELSRELARNFVDEDVDIVIGPAIGGIILSYEVARYLGAKALFAERENGSMTLRRGFFIPEGARVMVVEDVVTTGGSVQEVIDLVKSYNGEVVGVGVIVDRSGGQADFSTKLESVVKIDAVSFYPDNCPLCKKGIPVVKPGSRDFKGN